MNRSGVGARSLNVELQKALNRWRALWWRNLDGRRVARISADEQCEPRQQL